MDNAQELAQLKDIYLPEPITWWPIAPGWYGLIAIGLLIIISLVYLVHQKALRAKPKKQALALLNTYKQSYEREHKAQLTSARISELLKRVALVYYPRSEVAGLQGMAWLDFLNATSKGIDFKKIAPLLLESPFKTDESAELTPLINTAERWIKQRSKPCSN